MLSVPLDYQALILPVPRHFFRGEGGGGGAQDGANKDGSRNTAPAEKDSARRLASSSYLSSRAIGDRGEGAY